MTDTRLEGFTPIVELMHRIKSTGNSYPKVRLAFHNNPIVFSGCGEKSRTPGDINMTDGGRYNESRWYGRITRDGKLRAGEVMRRLHQEEKESLWDLLCELRDGNAEKVLAGYGHEFGECCMCGRELTNAESIEKGMGPICRARAFSVDKEVL